MEILGLNPGPEVGQAWSYLKELRNSNVTLEGSFLQAQRRHWVIAGIGQDRKPLCHEELGGVDGFYDIGKQRVFIRDDLGQKAG